MNPRAFISFFKSKVGALVLFLGLLVAGLIAVYQYKTPSNAPRKSDQKSAQHSAMRAIDPTLASLDPGKPQVVETVQGNMVPLQIPPEVAPAPSPTTLPKPAPTPTEKRPVLPPISLYAAESKNNREFEPVSKEFAPYGRLLRCELVVTVDSSAIETPVVGLVTEDVWSRGNLIIPAGTEVHGRASLNRARERIAAEGSWTLVWQSGEELTVNGVALDREAGDSGESGEGWGLTDGSAGLRGQIIKTDDLTELKLFAASFLSAGASAFQDTQTTVLGTRPSTGAKNAALSGLSAVLNSYAAQMLQAIRQDGMFVRVPAGKQFYLYITETLDRREAVIGGSRLEELKQPNRAPEQRYLPARLPNLNQLPQTSNPAVYR